MERSSKQRLIVATLIQVASFLMPMCLSMPHISNITDRSLREEEAVWEYGCSLRSYYCIGERTAMSQTTTMRFVCQMDGRIVQRTCRSILRRSWQEHGQGDDEWTERPTEGGDRSITPVGCWNQGKGTGYHVVLERGFVKALTPIWSGTRCPHASHDVDSKWKFVQCRWSHTCESSV